MEGSLDLTTGTLLPLSPIGQLTDQFYAWERRGRGWRVWSYPVELEPPFRPFYFHEPAPLRHVAIDDGRKPTALSSWADRLRGLIRGTSTTESAATDPSYVLDEPEPEYFEAPDAISEIQLSIPPDLRISHAAAETWLQALPVAGTPVAFEVIGTAKAITVQLVCPDGQAAGLSRQLAGHFPEAVLMETHGFLMEQWDAHFSGDTVLVDFGLSHEFMRPLRRFTDFNVDSLIAVTGALEDMRDGEIALLQVLFQPVRNPWAESVLRAVTDGQGKPFFVDAPEMVGLATEKIRRPLFAVVLRIAGRSPEPGRSWEIVRALGGALRTLASPTSNELIPLTNEGYPDTLHVQDVLLRQSHRSGMLLNLDELISLVHPPSASVRSAKLGRERARTKAAPGITAGHGLVLGENTHAGVTRTVTLSTAHRLRHMHLVGATGMGKSHLLLQMIRQDMEAGHGLAVFDPHGDLIDQTMAHVPECRIRDVVLVDPSDEAFPVGFNVLAAQSSLEKTLLASDLVGLFRRLATSWGDQMTAVLGNAVLAFLESPDGGTLLDLRRFLVDAAFRRAHLATVQDPEVVFFWEQEFPRLRKDATAPILTRLNAFLRPKPIRYMLAQKTGGLDLASVMEEGRILLVRLAHGLVGQENSTLLGALLLSRLQQLTLARQAIVAQERNPFFVYVDECHHFATPSLATILTSGRKYALGMVLAHQDLRQLGRDPEVESATLTNPAVRLSFRVSESDARKLAEGFSLFGADDLTKLGVGEATGRVERADFDFNLQTNPLPEVDPSVARKRREAIREHSRHAHGKPVDEVVAGLVLPEPRTVDVAIPRSPEPGEPPSPPEDSEREARRVPVEARPDTEETADVVPTTKPPSAPPALPGKGGAQHVYLQTLISRWATAHGWAASIEKEILGGLGRVDIALERDGVSAACEITVSTTPEHELANVQKGLAGGYDYVVVVSAEPKVLQKAARVIPPNLDPAQRAQVHFLTPEALFAFLEEREAEAAAGEDKVRGYTVKTTYKPVEVGEKEQRKKAVGKVIMDTLKRYKEKS